MLPVNRAHSSRRSDDGAGSGANRFAANGSSVSERVSRIAERSSSGDSSAPPSEPRPPVKMIGLFVHPVEVFR